LLSFIVTCFIEGLSRKRMVYPKGEKLKRI